MAKKKKAVSTETLDVTVKGKTFTLKNNKEIEDFQQWQLSGWGSRDVVNSFYSAVLKFNDADLFEEGDSGHWSIFCISTDIGENGGLIYYVTMRFRKTGWVEMILDEKIGEMKDTKKFVPMEMAKLLVQLKPC